MTKNYPKAFSDKSQPVNPAPETIDFLIKYSKSLRFISTYQVGQVKTHLN
ncbi:MAG: hypothetical protein RQ756_02145 [Flavobacteriaceae bacterium]|nr:hypothetical protein [Flavobacteriaceae bacterium]